MNAWHMVAAWQILVQSILSLSVATITETENAKKITFVSHLVGRKFSLDLGMVCGG